MQCTECGIGITSENASKREKGKWRKKCQKCENGRVLRWSRLNREKRCKAQTKYARSIGIGIDHPCETCGKMCKKKYKKAFCNKECRFMSHIKKEEI